MTEFFMPCGDDVIILLNQPALSNAFLAGLLRERGVFVKGVDRVHLVEQFVLTYISPSEYDAMMDRLATKEETLKQKTFTYTLGETDRTLAEIIPKPSDFEVSDVAGDVNQNYRIVGSPSFVKESEDCFILDYELERQNVGRNWLKSKERFKGKIGIVKDPESQKLHLRDFHSSAETKFANQLMRKWIRTDFESKNIVKKDSEKILKFGDFSHEQRMAFLMKFTGAFEGENFSFDKVTDFDFCVDDEKIPVAEVRLSWMKDAVSRSSLKGKRLHDIFVLKEKVTWSFIKLWTIELRFKISTADFEGSFALTLEFDGYGGSYSPSARFQLSVGSISSGKYKGSTEGVRKEVHKKFDSFVHVFAEQASTSVCAEMKE